ncbi:MAG: glycosyltransferase family 4 protein [Acidobacteria bacterium]|nr:glycosyltransferase family 4 protein [Acidobacteriota bacterium]
MAVQAEKLIAGLRAEGMIVTVVSTNPVFPAAVRALARWPGVRTAVSLGLLARALWRFLPECDIVHHLSCSHLYFFIVTAPTAALCKLFRKPHIINYRGGEAERFFGRWAAAVRAILRGCTVIVPSAFLQQVFARYDMKSRIVPNIADLERFTYRARKTLRPLCISTRNLEKLYNVRCTLEAFQLVQQVRPDAELLIAGDGSERAALERFVRDNGLPRVTFCGAVDHAAMAALYQQCDIFLNASIADNFPGAILEAAACGLPIVSSDAGGIPYLVEQGKTGLLVSVNDPRAMAEKILFLLNHPEYALELAENARSACRKYVWAAVYPQWLEVYEGLLAKS